MRFLSITGAGVLAAAVGLASTPATAQQSAGQPGPQLSQTQQQQAGSSQQQIQGQGVPLYVSPYEVKLVQRRLARLGLNPGPIDGRWRPQVQQALAQFQQQAGLDPTGNINVSTFNALRSARRPGGQFLGIGPQQQRGMGMQQQMQTGTQRHGAGSQQGTER